MDNWYNLTPAYGRDYNSKAAVMKDWTEGKDFKLNSMRGTTYCSIRDFIKGDKIQMRYSKLMKVTVITV